MDVAHAIFLSGNIDFSRPTADYLSAKFEIESNTFAGIAFQELKTFVSVIWMRPHKFAFV